MIESMMKPNLMLLLLACIVVGAQQDELVVVNKGKVCLASLDTPWIKTSRGTATAFAELALALNSNFDVTFWTWNTQEGCAEAALNKPKDVDMVCRGGSPVDILGTSALIDPRWIPDPLIGAHVFDNWLESRKSESKKCDVVITHEWSSPLHVALMRDRVEQPIFVEVVHGGTLWSGYWVHHGQVNRGADRLLTAEERQQWKASDVVVYPSTYMKRIMESLWGTRTGGSAIISNIATTPTDMEHVAVPYEGGEEIFLYFVGVVGRRKGYDIYLDVVCHCLQETKTNPRIKRIRPVVFGQTSSDPVDRLKKELPCDTPVEIRGATDSASMWRAIAPTRGVLLMTSRHENEPMVPLEASIHKYPMISLPTGGVREMIANSKDVIAENVRDMKDRALRAIRNGTNYVPLLSDHVTNAKSNWHDIVAHLLADFPNQRTLVTVEENSWELLDVGDNQTTANICAMPTGDDLSVPRNQMRRPAWLVLHDANAYTPVEGYEANVDAALALEDIGIVDKIVPVVVGPKGHKLATYEPYNLIQNIWQECHPSQPVTVRAEHYCKFLYDQQHATTSLSSSIDTQQVPPSWSQIAQFGIWFESQDLRARRVLDVWFTLAGSLVFATDCLSGDTDFYRDGHPASFFTPSRDTALQLQQSCAPFSNQFWGKAAKYPTLCRAKPVNDSDALHEDSFNIDNLKRSLPGNCGAWCVPSTIYKDVGWYLMDKGEDNGEGKPCWEPYVDLYAIDPCKEYRPPSMDQYAGFLRDPLPI